MNDPRRRRGGGEAREPIEAERGRRAFLGNVAAVALAMAGAAALPGGARAQPAPGDADILNFLLNLEYLQAEFYLRAAFGRGLSPEDATGLGRPGEVIVPDRPDRVPFATALLRQFAEEIAADEEAHVGLLRAQLGADRVARPRLDLKDSFTRCARAAGLIRASQVFNPFASQNNFCLAAFILEDVGVTACKGALRILVGPDSRDMVAGLLAAEAYHAAEIRALVLDANLFGEARALSDFRDSLDGDADLDEGVRSGATNARRANIVPTDPNGLAFGRTPEQVLTILYLGGAANGFGFFPDRVNDRFPDF